MYYKRSTVDPPRGDGTFEHDPLWAWKFHRCPKCGVVVLPSVVRWISPRYVFGWKLRGWIREWSLHRYEDGTWDLGPYRYERDRAFGLWRWYLIKDYHERESWVVGRILMKESPDVDYYVGWSSIVDAPVFTGNREEALEYLRANHRRKYSPDDRDSPENLLKLVDETGTSQRFKFPTAGCPSGAWEHDGFVYEGRAWITRANVFVACHRMDDDAAIDDLLEEEDG
jgi:hypothetical protein